VEVDPRSPSQLHFCSNNLNMDDLNLRSGTCERDVVKSLDPPTFDDCIEFERDINTFYGMVNANSYT
jgi:hypothetical protein